MPHPPAPLATESRRTGWLGWRAALGQPRTLQPPRPQAWPPRARWRLRCPRCVGAGAAPCGRCWAWRGGRRRRPHRAQLPPPGSPPRHPVRTPPLPPRLPLPGMPTMTRWTARGSCRSRRSPPTPPPPPPSQWAPAEDCDCCPQPSAEGLARAPGPAARGSGRGRGCQRSEWPPTRHRPRCLGHSRCAARGVPGATAPTPYRQQKGRHPLQAPQ